MVLCIGLADALRGLADDDAKFDFVVDFFADAAINVLLIKHYNYSPKSFPDANPGAFSNKVSSFRACGATAR